MIVSTHALSSDILGETRTFWLHRPAFPVASAQLLVFLDGERYREWLQAPAWLEQQETDTSTSAIIGLFVSSGPGEARWRDYPCSPPFADFVHRELLPAAIALLPSTTAVGKMTIIGLSYSGLAAAYLALRSPATWSQVIAQSGSFWSQEGWLTAQFRQLSTPLPTHFWLEVGTRETAVRIRHRPDVWQEISQLEAVRGFHTALRETGHTLTYREFLGGHDFSAWRQTLPTALAWAVQRPA